MRARKRTHAPTDGLLVKVPALTAAFWVAKLLTTGTGEATSDFLAHRALWALGLAVVGLVAALVRQLRADRYRPATYWTVVLLVAVVGTVAADAVKLVGVPLPVVTAGYAAALLICLATWRSQEGTLSVHSIDTRRREVFYWTAVLLSFALGTAAGDLTALYLGWGYLVSAALFAMGMIIPWLLYRSGRIGEVAAFWIAYVMTRPVGATIADWLGKPSGLGLGDGTVAIVGLVSTMAMIGYFVITRTGDPEPAVVRTAVTEESLP